MRAARIICLVSCSFAAWAQPASKNGLVRIVLQNRIEPSSPAYPGKTPQPGLSVASARWFHRYFADTTQKQYFGYDFFLEQAGTEALRITFQPLSWTPKQVDDPGSWSTPILPSYPAPQIVNNGHIVALDVMFNPATGQKIVDYLVVECNAGNGASSRSRDFSVADAGLRIVAPRLTVDGKSIEMGRGAGSDVVAYRDFALGIVGIGEFEGFPGNPWVYLAGHGRFVFSLTPREGYQKVGEVRGSSLSFSIGGNKYVLTCRDKIASGSNTYNVYILHDPAYSPKGTGKDPVFLQGDGL
jgi:hypothetical protein